MLQCISQLYSLNASIKLVRALNSVIRVLSFTNDRQIVEVIRLLLLLELNRLCRQIYQRVLRSCQVHHG